MENHNLKNTLRLLQSVDISSYISSFIASYSDFVHYLSSLRYLRDEIMKTHSLDCWDETFENIISQSMDYHNDYKLGNIYSRHLTISCENIEWFKTSVDVHLMCVGKLADLENLERKKIMPTHRHMTLLFLIIISKFEPYGLRLWSFETFRSVEFYFSGRTGKDFTAKGSGYRKVGWLSHYVFNLTELLEIAGKKHLFDKRGLLSTEVLYELLCEDYAKSKKVERRERVRRYKR